MSELQKCPKCKSNIFKSEYDDNLYRCRCSFIQIKQQKLLEDEYDNDDEIEENSWYMKDTRDMEIWSNDEN